MYTEETMNCLNKMAIDMTDCVMVLFNSIYVYDQSLSIVKKIINKFICVVEGQV
jgi:hypothetical protein